ncbi:factor of DNA methylation 4-like [Vicia villosa]|uniref:factor of DNA methylation 4-like n=1 Tax=Vicia villosa TaxID=3911 RepID=UPI00273C2DE7|nr:factor of DNA methylation 4-like [Vicia villosa]
MMNRKTEYTRESDLEHYERKYFKDLKDDYYKLEVSDSTFRCPFCLNKDYYSLTDLSRHASRIASDVHGETVKEIGKHSALVRYLKSLNVNVAKDKSPILNVPEDKFVCPWTVVLANIVTKFDPNSRKYVGKSGKEIQEELFAKGFKRLTVTTLWNSSGQTKFAIVEFGKEWDAFADACLLERMFESEHCGKRDYYRSRERGDKLFGWMARADDYNSSNIVGKYLQDKVDLKTVFEKKAEDDRKALKLAASKSRRTRNWNWKKQQTKISNMRNAERNYLENLSKDREKTVMEVEARRNKLMASEKNLRKRKADNDNERNNLYLEKKNIEMAIAEQQKADNEMMRLAEKHKKQKEKLHKKMHDLVKGLDAKHALQLETERLRGAFNVMNHLKETDQEEKKKLEAIKVELREKEKQLEDLLRTLVIEEPKTNDELQDARKKLINWIGYPGDTSQVIISVKRMGELDLKPFIEASKRKFPAEENWKAAQWCSQCEDYLRDLSWKPFKIVTDEKGNSKEILDENDEKLKSLRDELGDEVHDAVATALKELNEYNPSGRYPVPELWNFREGRKASLKEGVAHLMSQWKLSKAD